MAAEGLDVAVRATDIADPDACQRLVIDVLAEHGRIDHLINNAGLLIEKFPSNDRG
jgi:NAD(P)-dependent dehydrogenase (short-subunit alcohol dehydrogenase family)